MGAPLGRRIDKRTGVSALGTRAPLGTRRPRAAQLGHARPRTVQALMSRAHTPSVPREEGSTPSLPMRCSPLPPFPVACGPLQKSNELDEVEGPPHPHVGGSGLDWAVKRNGRLRRHRSPQLYQKGFTRGFPGSHPATLVAPVRSWRCVLLCSVRAPPRTAARAATRSTRRNRRRRRAA